MTYSFKKISYAFFVWFFLLTPFIFAQQAPAPAAVEKAAVPEIAEQSVPSVPDSSAKISLDFKDAEVGTVLRVISLKSGVNIVAGPEVTGTVTIRLEEVEWEKALDVILRTYNYVYEKNGNVIRVTTRDKMQQEPVDTKTFILNYSKASEVMTSIQDILTERGRVKVADRMNMLIVTDIPTNIFHISQVIERLDKMTPQAYIDSKIIKTQEGVTKNMGVKWNLAANATGSARPTTFPFPSNDGTGVPSSLAQFFPRIGGADVAANIDNPRDFPVQAIPEAIAQNTGTTRTVPYSYGTLDFSSLTAALNFIEANSKTKIVSNPRITVLNNQTAKVQVGDQIPMPAYERNQQTGDMQVSGFTYRDIGVVLNVTPHINSANEILVELKPEVTSQGANLSFGEFQAPIFNTTSATTQVLIQSGETIAIGGLLTDNDSTAVSKVPYLSDIPLIGKLLFRGQTSDSGTNTDAETLFFVTVTSVDSRGQPYSDTARKNNLYSQDTASTSVKNSASKDASSAAGNPKPVV